MGAPTRPRRRLILGYGNSLRSDDGVGPRAAAALQSELSSPDLLVIAARQLTPEMAEAVARSSQVLFLDCSHTGDGGEIRCEKIGRDPDYWPGTLSHDLLPAALLELARRYFQAEPEAWLLTMTGANFDLGEHFSAVVEAAYGSYLDRVREWVCAV